jgi:hypothetical protein
MWYTDVKTHERCCRHTGKDRRKGCRKVCETYVHHILDRSHCTGYGADSLLSTAQYDSRLLSCAKPIKGLAVWPLQRRKDSLH